MPWRQIAAFFPDVPPATLCAIYRHGREPQKPAVRRALGLPLYAPGRVCPVHGVVHDRLCRPRRAGPKRPRVSYRKLFLLLWAAWLAGRPQVPAEGRSPARYL